MVFVRLCRWESLESLDCWLQNQVQSAELIRDLGDGCGTRFGSEKLEQNVVRCDKKMVANNVLQQPGLTGC